MLSQNTHARILASFLLDGGWSIVSGLSVRREATDAKGTERERRWQ
jgi:hypothetical protein